VVLGSFRILFTALLSDIFSSIFRWFRHLILRPGLFWHGVFHYLRFVFILFCSWA